MRLFTGLSVAPGVVAEIEGLLAGLRPCADLRWSPVANLHITTAFIGGWEEHRLAELATALGRVSWPGSIPVSVTGFGYFPNPHHPHSLFLAVKPEPALTTLVAAINAALRQVGCAVEERDYHPHITLARIARENITQLRDHTASMKTFPLSPFPASAFHLYRSRPAPGGSVYSRLATFPAAENLR